MRSTHGAGTVTHAAMKCLRAVTLILAGALLPAAGSTQEHAAVDIGGRRLDVLRVGTGAPVRIQAAGTVEGLTALPDIPLAVLTSMRIDSTARFVNGTARGHEVWRALHDEWFQRSRNGIHIETSRSGHDIQSSEPGLVINAIRFVLDRVRANERP